jgi:multimeric flavodoxin WrbA
MSGNKIIVLAGSPRKEGNTDRLVAAFVKGAEKNNEVEVFSVHNYKVNPCIGCNSCFSRERNNCFQNDDMQQIYKKLSEADILVIASPVYFYGISSQLKTVIDRLHTPLRNSFNIKKLALILVGAAELPEMFDAILTQYKLTLNFFKLEDAGKVLVRGAKDKGDVTQVGLEQAYKLGLSINA